MLAITINRLDPRALPEQVADELKRLIAAGLLAAGERLPSSRALARSLDLSRNTIVHAYERLHDEGWLTAGVGRGTFVAEGRAQSPTRRPPPAAFPWKRIAARTARGRRAIVELPEDRSAIDLSGAVPSHEAYPIAAVRRALQKVLRERGGRALDYGPPAGAAPLRQLIAHRAGRAGAPASPEQVLITSGVQQGLDLIARFLVAPGDRVLVEAPSYANAIETWRLYGGRVEGLPLDEGGLDPERLDAALRREPARLLYLMPSFQNPTGLCLDRQRRQDIMAIARRHGLVIVEDHFDAELRYRGAPLPPLRAFDEAGQVILVGSISKSVFPGFRIGWLIAPPLARERLLELKMLTDLSTGYLNQMALDELWRNGEIDRHLERVRRRNRRRLDAMLEAIDRYLPEDIQTTRPCGGMTLWLTAPPELGAIELEREARRRGLRVAPGVRFFPDQGGEHHLRLGFAAESPERIEQGLRLLGQTFEDLLSRRRESRPSTSVTAPFL